MTTLGLGVGLGRPMRRRVFLPLQLSTLKAWYDAGDASTVSHSSNAISQWNDKSGQGRHVAQAGASTLKPTYDGVNGKVFFDGGDYLFNNAPFMQAAGKSVIYAVVSAPNAQGTALIAEGRSSNANPVYAPVWTEQGAASPDVAMFVRNDAGSVLYAGTLGTSGVLFDATKKLVRIVDDGEFFKTYSNGSLSPTIVQYTRSGVTTFDRFCIGGLLRTSFSSGWTGEIYEMVIADSDDNGLEMEGYLAHRHGLAVNLPSWHPYKGKPPAKGKKADLITMDGGALTLAAFGDSITDFSATPGGSVAAFENIGYVTAYHALSRGRMRTDPGKNLGVAGNTTTQMVARKTDLAAQAFDVCLFMGGINDIKSEQSTSSIISNIANILDYITLTLGKRVVAVSVLPNDNWQVGWSAGQISTARAKILTVNRFIMSQHGSRMGRVVAVDAYTNFSNGSDLPKPNATFDNIHPAPYGAMLIGKDIRDRLLPIYGDGTSDFTVSNLLSNGVLAGTGGTAGSNFSGQVANGFTASGAGGTGGRTASKVTGGQRLSMTVTGGTATDTMRLSQSISSGFAIGDTVYAAALVEVQGTPANIIGSALSLHLTGSGIPFLANVVAMDDDSTGFSATAHPIAETYMAPGQYLLVTPDLSITSGSGIALEWRYEMKGNSTVSPLNGTIDILGAGIFKR
jgi:lysophospholipase L1-like esterase